jgi:glycosyltransferase involved in cell wall biosynthesis
LRIVQAVGWYAPDSLGGTELYVAALAEQLRQAGHEVVVAAPHTGSGERRYTHDAIEIYRYPIPRDPTRAEARGEVTARGADTLHRWFAHTKPDVVHFHTFVTGLGLQEVDAARAAGAKVIVTSHAASLGFLCQRGTLLYRGRALCDGLVGPVKCAACALEQRAVPQALANGLARVPRALASLAVRATGRGGTALGMRTLIERNQAAQKRLFEAASAFAVLSDWAASVLRANGAPAQKVVVNRLGIDMKRGPWTHKPSVALRSTPSPVTVGFIGRAESIKGLEDLVRAVTSLAASVPLQLRVVATASSAEERTIVERCRTRAAADPRVSFLPPADPTEIPSLLAEIDVLACPSRAVEGGPTIALEAHAVGTPVVGAAMPALTEYVTDGVNGALFPPGDWKQLAECLRRVALDPAATVDRWRAALPSTSLGAGKRRRTFHDIAREYLELYRAA